MEAAASRIAQYYLITFTLPKQLRDLAWKNQRQVYSLMFACVQDTLKIFTKNDKKLGGSPGFTTILHTHFREQRKLSPASV
jgi:hypothetical protein